MERHYSITYAKACKHCRKARRGRHMFTWLLNDSEIVGTLKFPDGVFLHEEDVEVNLNKMFREDGETCPFCSKLANFHLEEIEINGEKLIRRSLEISAWQNNNDYVPKIEWSGGRFSGMMLIGFLNSIEEVLQNQDIKPKRKSIFSIFSKASKDDKKELKINIVSAPRNRNLRPPVPKVSYKGFTKGEVLEIFYHVRDQYGL